MAGNDPARSGTNHLPNARWGGDTSPEAAEILLERRRRLSASQRVEEGMRLSQLAREFMRAGIRARHPAYAPAEVEEALARLLWGDELYRRARPNCEPLEP
jgi:hypothetical protein